MAKCVNYTSVFFIFGRTNKFAVSEQDSRACIEYLKSALRQSTMAALKARCEEKRDEAAR